MKALGVLVGLMFAVLFDAWLLMLVLGALHSELPQAPVASYHAAIWLSALGHILSNPTTFTAETKGSKTITLRKGAA